MIRRTETPGVIRLDEISKQAAQTANRSGEALRSTSYVTDGGGQMSAAGTDVEAAGFFKHSARESSGSTLMLD